jgi:hypothetical protein
MRLSLNDTAPIGWLLFALVVVGAGLACWIAIIPSNGYKFVGEGMLAIGLINVLFFRIFGRQTFRMAQAMPGWVPQFWEKLGQDVSGYLYLGIGLMLLAAAGFLLIRQT